MNVISQAYSSPVFVAERQAVADFETDSKFHEEYGLDKRWKTQGSFLKTFPVEPWFGRSGATLGNLLLNLVMKISSHKWVGQWPSLLPPTPSTFFCIYFPSFMQDLLHSPHQASERVNSTAMFMGFPFSSALSIFQQGQENQRARLAVCFSGSLLADWHWLPIPRYSS